VKLLAPLRNDDNQVIYAPCPRCGETRALRMALLEADEAREYNVRSGLWDDVVIYDDGHTGPPGHDYDHMAQTMPWVSCTTCGYDGHYIIGSGGQ
jgi:hypothetical protein